MIEVARVEALAEEAGSIVAGWDPIVPGETAAAVALAARRCREAADWLEVHALGAVERSGLADAGGESTAAWFAREAHLPGAAAKGQVRLARLLETDLAPTAEAWARGRIGRDHVAVLARAANPRVRDQVTAAQGDLIDLAEGRTFEHWRAAVAGLVESWDGDGPDPSDPATTTASWARTDGFAELRARFGGASAEVVEQILDAKTDELFRRQAADARRCPDLARLSRNQLRGHAIVELLVHAQGIDLSSSKPPRTMVTLVIRGDLDPQPGDGQVPWVNGLPDLHGKPVLPPTITAGGATWSVANPNHVHLAAEHLATLICDCTVETLLVDDHANPLDLGATVRLATPPQRRAVLVRDGTCVFPGCTCPARWVDIHHRHRFDDGGPTDVANLVALCRWHHGIVHRRGWHLHATDDGWHWWETPSGRTRWGQRHGHQRAGPAPPAIHHPAAA